MSILGTAHALRSSLLAAFLLTAAACMQPAQSGAQDKPLSASSAPQAQAGHPDNTTALLRKPVHLPSGVNTVKATLEAIAAQTGLHIEAVDYLQERKIVTQIGELSAQDALDTLVELHDWRWYDNGKGVIVVTRRRVTLPQTLTELPVCLRATLPADMRAFLGVGVPITDIPPKEYMGMDGRPARVPSNKNLDIERMDRIQWRLGRLAQQKAERLLAMLKSGLDAAGKADIAAGKTRDWNSLTSAQRQEANDTLLLTYLGQACGGSYLRLLHGGLWPYEADINAAELRLVDGNGFFIGLQDDGMYTAIGVGIPGLKSTFKMPKLGEIENP